MRQFSSRRFRPISNNTGRRVSILACTRSSLNRFSFRAYTSFEWKFDDNQPLTSDRTMFFGDFFHVKYDGGGKPFHDRLGRLKRKRTVTFNNRTEFVVGRTEARRRLNEIPKRMTAGVTRNVCKFWQTCYLMLFCQRLVHTHTHARII